MHKHVDMRNGGFLGAIILLGAAAFFLQKNKIQKEAPPAAPPEEKASEIPAIVKASEIPAVVYVSNIGNAPAIPVQVVDDGRINAVPVGQYLVRADSYALMLRRIASQGGQWMGDTWVSSPEEYAAQWTRRGGIGHIGEFEGCVWSA